MMRHDGYGTLDNGLTTGHLIEGGVTLGAPLAVGMAMAPKAPPQTLRSVGALPEIEATSVAASVARQGRIIETQGKFSPRERPLAEFLAKEGKTVEKLPENHALPGRKADALVDGVRTEFKKPRVGATNATIKTEISMSIKRGGQARDMIIDARGTGLTEAEARRGLARAAGITRGRIDSVRVVGDGFDITATNFK